MTKSKRVLDLIEELKNKQTVDQIHLCAKAYKEWDGEDKERAGRMLDYYDNLHVLPMYNTDEYDYLEDDEFYTCPMTGNLISLDGTIL